MSVLRAKDALKMSEKEREDKLKDLRIELVKISAGNKQSSKIRPKEIKKAIARLKTFNNADKINRDKNKEDKNK